jgi:glycosyltransferase involved in cell wall biosynthesis
MRLAYFSPLPPTPSGIADYSSELLPHLVKQANITLFVDRLDAVDAGLRNQFDIRTQVEYPSQRHQFDLSLYHMGNNVHHEQIYSYALRYPGVVVLHDLFLHHFIGSITFVKDDYLSYARELGYAMGSEGLDLFSDIRLGRRRFPVFELPLCNRLVDRSLGLIVHSLAAAEAVQSMRPDRPAKVIPAPIAPREGRSLRQSLGISEQTVIFASLGFVNATKQIELTLRKIAQLREAIPDIYYVIVGGVQGDLDLSKLITELGLEEVVTCTGYVPDLQTFIDWTATADVVVNLRYPTMGETSAAALRAMSAGKPTIVFDHGWYAELPDDVCIKVLPMDSDALLSAMKELAANPAVRLKMGERALQAASTTHDPSSVAAGYTDFLETCLRGISRNYR